MDNGESIICISNFVTLLLKFMVLEITCEKPMFLSRLNNLVFISIIGWVPFFYVCDIIAVLVFGSFTLSLLPGTPHLHNWLVQAISGGTFSNKFKKYSASSWSNAITWLQHQFLPAGHVHEAFSAKLVLLLICTKTFSFTFFMLSLQQRLAKKKWPFPTV